MKEPYILHDRGARSLLIRVVRFRPSERSRKFLLGISGVLFLVLTGLAIPRVAAFDLSSGWLSIAAGICLLSPFTNAAEYWLAGRWVGVKTSPRHALQITIMASAANLAPIPGAVLVRGRELYSLGADGVEVAKALAAIGAAWVTVAMAAAALAVSVVGETVPALLLWASSGVCCGAVLAIRPSRVSKATVLRAAGLVELIAVAVESARIYAILRGLGIEVELLQTIAFPAAGAVGSAVGLFPGGLGLREMLAGGLAALVGLSPSVGVIGAAGDRVLGLSILVMFALGLAFTGRKNRG